MIQKWLQSRLFCTSRQVWQCNEKSEHQKLTELKLYLVMENLSGAKNLSEKKSQKKQTTDQQ